MRTAVERRYTQPGQATLGCKDHNVEVSWSWGKGYPALQYPPCPNDASHQLTHVQGDKLEDHLEDVPAPDATPAA